MNIVDGDVPPKTQSLPSDGQRDGESPKTQSKPKHKDSVMIVRIPEDLATGGTLKLSPFDISNGGRATPMCWFYRETLATDMLLEALQKTLVSYQVFCGRYSSPPLSVELCNAGVPVQIHTMDRSVVHFLDSLLSFVAVFIIIYYIISYLRWRLSGSYVRMDISVSAR